MLRTTLFLLATFAAGCAQGGAMDEGVDSETEGALATSSLDAGVYFIEGATPKKDALLGLRVDASGKGDLLWSYQGDPGRISRACAVKAAVKGSGSAKSLELRCPADTFSYPLVKSEGGVLELKNPTGEALTLKKVEPSFRGDVRLACDADEFTARIDVVSGDGGARRALIRIEMKDVEHNLGTPLAETLWVSGKAKMTGLDLKDNDYDLTLPMQLSGGSGDISAKLGFVNELTPFTPDRVEHALTCRVE